MNAFSLSDSAGKPCSFPTGRHALLCFVKEDCPTCNLVLPLVKDAARDFQNALDVMAIGQDAEGNRLMVQKHGFDAPMLDDSQLKISYGFDIEIVPTAILADPAGNEVKRVVGFNRTEWQQLFAQAGAVAGIKGPVIQWEKYPGNRPGCGSKSVEPGIAERLAAEAGGDRLRARRIQIGDAQDVFEFMFEHGMTDGLPVIPPTPERVAAMLAGTRRDSQEVVAVVPPNLAPCSVEKVAINAVMAGCKPEYLPVVLAAVEAVCDPAFNVHGVMATTAGGTPVMVINGPIRHQLGMNMKLGALGYGSRPNNTMGRALKLVLRNIGGFRLGGVERATLSSPNKFTVCFPEWEERSQFEPLHVERGFRPEQNVVTLFGTVSGCFQINDHTSRTAVSLANNFAECIRVMGTPKGYKVGESLMVLGPEHADTLRRAGWSKTDLRNHIQKVTARRIIDLLPADAASQGISWEALGIQNVTVQALNSTISKFDQPENLNIVVAGGEAGKFTAVFPGWGGVWQSVSRPIDPWL
jgi:hypothetical protein